MKRLFLSATVAFLLLTAVCARADVMEFYKYDKTRPLHPQVRELSRNAEFVQYHVVYDSVNGEHVPALLNLPLNAKAPYPCVIAQHGYSGNKKDNLIFSLKLARLGYAMFAIDAQYHGERKRQGKDIFSLNIIEDVKAIIQTVIDLRRALDYLETRPEIDSSRIGYVGISMGGVLGSIFSGVDERVKCPILIVGGGGWRTLVSLSQIGPAIVMRKYIEQNHIDMDEVVREFDNVEPLNFIGRVSPRPVLFINGKRDIIVPVETNKLLHDAAREPKTIVWFDGVEGEPTGHLPPINDILEICTKWWKENL